MIIIMQCFESGINYFLKYFLFKNILKLFFNFFKNIFNMNIETKNNNLKKKTKFNKTPIGTPP